MSICDLPFNSDFSKFNANNDSQGAKNYIDNYNKCLEDKISSVEGDMSKFMNITENQNNNLISAEQMNEDTINLYRNDYYYVISKGIVYLIILGGFIYFFGISNLINGIKTTGTLVKDKAIMIKDKVVKLNNAVKRNNIKDNMKDVKDNINNTDNNVKPLVQNKIVRTNANVSNTIDLNKNKK